MTSGRNPLTPRAGLFRPRLVERLSDPDRFRVAYLVAPAGSGKSVLLAQVASSFPGRVAWCGPAPAHATSEDDVAQWIGDALEGSGPFDSVAAPVSRRVSNLEELRGFKAPGGEPLLVAIDDAHLLGDGAPKRALCGLVESLPQDWRLIVASRERLGADVSQLEVGGDFVEYGPDDLRFRAWEVEDLFRKVYSEPLLPEEAATLTRRTSGWAAYLQLFYLATTRKPETQRRDLMEALTRRVRLVSDYLGRQVLDGLEPDLSEFLLTSAVLRRPDPQSCSELLGCEADEARARLDELERRQIFTERVTGDAFRYHPVLVSYLDAKLVAAVGLEAAREQHRRAAGILETRGRYDEALEAYIRCEDWESVRRLIREHRYPAGESDDGHANAGTLSDAVDEMLVEAVPGSMLDSDPLMMMSVSSRLVRSGNLPQAASVLRRAETVAGSAELAGACREMHHKVTVWLDPAGTSESDPAGIVRSATCRKPLGAAQQATAIPGSAGRVVEGICYLLAGDFSAARRLLRSARSAPDLAAWSRAFAALAEHAAQCCVGQAEADTDLLAQCDRLRDEVEHLGIPWLCRLAEVILGSSGELAGTGRVDELLAACARHGDLWGGALISLVAGMRGLARRDLDAPARLSEAAEKFSVLGANVLHAQSVAAGCLALSAVGEVDLARSSALHARTLADLYDVPAAAAVSAALLGELDGLAASLDEAGRRLSRLGLWDAVSRLLAAGPVAAGRGGDDFPADPAASAQGGGASQRPPVVVRCLGGFAMSVAGRNVDETKLKPMERAILHLLAMRAGKAIHREELIVALWPDADIETAKHRLQVGLSSIRRMLDAHGQGSHLVVREADSYRLDLPSGSEADVVAFEAAISQARRAQTSGDKALEIDSLRNALSAYAGPLLPEDGPADWVVDQRDRLQGEFVGCCVRLADILAESGDNDTAASVARRGLEVDKYHDRLWRILIDSLEASQRTMEARKAHDDYYHMLEDLGISPRSIWAVGSPQTSRKGP